MAIHKLKTWPDFWLAIKNGRKTFEVRKADRPFKVGDVLLLQEWDNRTERYTGRELEKEVTYIMAGGAFGIAPDHCVMGLF